MFEAAETLTRDALAWLRLLVETLGAIVIAVGIAAALLALVRHALGRSDAGFNQVRLRLGRYLLLALELQLAADILSTAIAPSWDQIGKLAAIAIIRTLLNYFLMLEIREEEGERKRNKDVSPG
ncbi:DUF1622 domain-containing protein [Massilia sp. PAMC28688]|uniref:DUF1622 domain-containing protein n=1 Tax=Massilia sp. PAMC28688 TaxID=2861283 RepID=UPI001C62C814|nr:DUF1622 domain-containing protein [Massilia sp. PAMC28688]QYF94363.1 DUF1622 domain-containing protein [Massilia sp. PAMC28688]